MNGDALSRAACAALAMLAACALAACGPDDATSDAAHRGAANAPARNATPDAATQYTATIPPLPGATSSFQQPQQEPAGAAAGALGRATIAGAAPPVAASGSPPAAALPESPASPDPVASVQASLAADSRQVAPVMRFAPDDNAH